jgi:hypothetical protein
MSIPFLRGNLFVVSVSQNLIGRFVFQSWGFTLHRRSVAGKVGPPW